MSEKKPTCVWPRCGKKVSFADVVATVGENSGPKMFVCAEHRPKVELTKAIVGSSALVGFQVGMDKAYPGVREKIGDFGRLAVDIYKSMSAKKEPAE